MRTILLVIALVCAVLAVPLGAEAQTEKKTWRIGWLGDGTRAAREANSLAPLREGLRELGYVEGQNILIDARWSNGNDEHLARNAAEFVRAKVDVIVTHGSVAGMVAKKATATIPIVIATAADLVGAGLVASLARPGGNVTGTSDQAHELTSKHLDVIAELLPGLQRVAVFWYRSNPLSPPTAEAFQGAARRRGFQVTALAAATPDDVARLVDTAARDRAGGLIVVQDSWTLSNRASIVQHALAKRLPVLANTRLFPEVGGLASYGADLRTVYRHAAVFVDKILKGVKPADIPVEQPTKFEMVINLKTARALGLTIPPSLLLRADQLIE
jgi:putative tryptophan/tyrosine transport system substrate-binding protein